jgi:hypothetical protein
MNKIWQITHSQHLQGPVASTGNSALAGVLDGLATFGGHGYFSPASDHWKALRVKYFDELDQIHWEETGRHLPRRADGGTKQNNNKRKPRASRVPIANLVASMMELA